MREVEVVPATAAELDAIERIENASFPKPWCRAFFAEELRLPGRLSLVASRDGRVLGYLFAMWIFEEMHVNKIAVAPELRRQGIADALMAHALTFAQEHDVEQRQPHQPDEHRGAGEEDRLPCRGHRAFDGSRDITPVARQLLPEAGSHEERVVDG